MRDDVKAPFWSFDATFEFLRSATPRRKIIVIGELSEIGNIKKADAYRRIAVRAQEVADISVFVGPWAFSVLNFRKPGDTGGLHAFGRVRDAANFINSITQSGDLILLKGNVRQDHFLRIILDRTGDVACWQDNCQRIVFCDTCPERLKPSGLPLKAGAAGQASPEAPSLPAAGKASNPDIQLVVGLGNSQPEYAGTPHNAGFEAVDALAKANSMYWEETPTAWVARGEIGGIKLCVVKLRSAINLTGDGLTEFAASLGVGAAGCVIVYDDLATPLGKVRTRTNGGAGGHKGAASVFEAFQTNDIRRVKIGIGIASSQLDRSSYVTTPFDESSRKLADAAMPVAVAQITELLRLQARRMTAQADSDAKAV